MKLIYFDNESRNTIAIVASQIVAIEQNRVPTETPTTVLLSSGERIRVRNGFDECQRRLMMTEDAL